MVQNRRTSFEMAKHAFLIIGVLLLAGCGEGGNGGGARNDLLPMAAHKIQDQNLSTAQPSAAGAATKTPQEPSSMTNIANLPTCQEMLAHVDAGATPDELFEKYLPKELAADNVDQAKFSTEDMEKIVTFLSCSADLHDYDAYVADNALALFTSKTHRAAAFSALDRVEQKGGEEGTYAKRFADQMHNYNDGPNG